jgi:hypothetical protein
LQKHKKNLKNKSLQKQALISIYRAVSNYHRTCHPDQAAGAWRDLPIRKTADIP